MKRLVTAAVLVTLATALTGCGLTSASDSTTPDVTSVTEGAPHEVAPGTAAPDTPVAADRSVVRTAALTVSADDPQAAGRSAESTATSLGGYVESVTTDGAVSSTVVLRIPADRYDAAVESLRGLGDVTALDVTADDVTAQQTDLDARIRAQRASVARVQDLMKRAGSLSEVVQVEQELASRQAELESLEAQRARLADQVSLATITASFVPAGAAPGTAWWQPAVNALVASWQGLVVALAALSPLLVLGAAVAVGALAVVRRTRRRQTVQRPREPVA